MFFSRVTLNPDITTTSLSGIIADRIYSKHRLLWDLFPGQQRRTFLFREEFEGEQIKSRSKHQLKGTSVYYVVSADKPESNVLFCVEPKEYKPRISEGEVLSFRLRANATVTREGKRHDIAMDAQNRFLVEFCANNQLSVVPGRQMRPQKRDYKKAILTAASMELDQQLTRVLEACDRYRVNLTIIQNRRELLDCVLKSSMDHALESWLVAQGEKKGFELISRGENLGIGRYERHAIPEKGKNAEFHSVDLSGSLEVKNEGVFIDQALFNGVGRARAFGCGLMMVRRTQETCGK